MASVLEKTKAQPDTGAPVAHRIAFVSGGMGGIGTAICRRLGRVGHTVVAGCLPGYEKKSEWLDRMRAEGFRVHAAEGDVGHFDSCAEMFGQIASAVEPGVAPAIMRALPRGRLGKTPDAAMS